MVNIDAVMIGSVLTVVGSLIVLGVLIFKARQKIFRDK